MPTRPVLASQCGAVPRNVSRWAGAALLLVLAGCATAPEVQTLATGSNSMSAYTLNGSDLDELRKEAGRLCPLGSEVLRQAMQGAPVSEPASGRWRRALQATALWLDPPARTAQLVILCREPGDRMRLAAATGQAAPASAAVPSARSASATATATAPEFSAALPVGPVMPAW